MKILYLDAVEDEKRVVQCLQGLKEDGSILVRGLKFDQEKFESFTQRFCKRFYRVTSREKFRQTSGDGLTTLTPPDNFHLLGHVEVDYVPAIKTPDMVFFFCQIAPNVSGGETFLVDGVEMFNALPVELKDRFLNENITYEFLWESERWQAQYNICNEEELHQIFAGKENVKYTLDDGWLHMFYTTSGTVQFQDGSIAFSNAILAHLPSIDHPISKTQRVYTKESNRVFWQSGEIFSNETINQLIDVHNQCKRLHVWQDNDFLIFDNFRYLHGREETIMSSERKILSRFGYA